MSLARSRALPCEASLGMTAKARSIMCRYPLARSGLQMMGGAENPRAVKWRRNASSALARSRRGRDGSNARKRSISALRLRADRGRDSSLDRIAAYGPQCARDARLSSIIFALTQRDVGAAGHLQRIVISPRAWSTAVLQARTCRRDIDMANVESNRDSLCHAPGPSLKECARPRHYSWTRRRQSHGGWPPKQDSPAAENVRVRSRSPFGENDHAVSCWDYLVGGELDIRYWNQQHVSLRIGFHDALQGYSRLGRRSRSSCTAGRPRRLRDR